LQRVGVTNAVVFGQELVLTDGNGVETPALIANFTCEPSSP
jgi:hypothetical protein